MSTDFPYKAFLSCVFHYADNDNQKALYTTFSRQFVKDEVHKRSLISRTYETLFGTSDSYIYFSGPSLPKADVFLTEANHLLFCLCTKCSKTIPINGATKTEDLISNEACDEINKKVQTLGKSIMMNTKSRRSLEEFRIEYIENYMCHLVFRGLMKGEINIMYLSTIVDLNSTIMIKTVEKLFKSDDWGIYCLDRFFLILFWNMKGEIFLHLSQFESSRKDKRLSILLTNKVMNKEEVLKWCNEIPFEKKMSDVIAGLHVLAMDRIQSSKNTGATTMFANDSENQVLALSRNKASKTSKGETTMFAPDKLCHNRECTNEGTKRCAQCQKVYYCGENCQKIDWKIKHRTECNLPKK